MSVAFPEYSVTLFHFTISFHYHDVFGFVFSAATVMEFSLKFVAFVMQMANLCLQLFRSMMCMLISFFVSTDLSLKLSNGLIVTFVVSKCMVKSLFGFMLFMN